MANTNNYGWTTPDDTALVKDGASAIRSLGTSVDTTTKNLNPSTTLGDIEYRSSTANTNTRLGIGSTGNVLTVAGGVPTWAAPATGGKSFSLLNTGGTSLSTGTTTISGISGIDELFIIIKDASSTATQPQVYFQINSNNNNVYNSITSYGTYASTYGTNNFQNYNSFATNLVYGPGLSSNAASLVDGYIRISGCKTAGIKIFDMDMSATPAGGNGQQKVSVGGYFDSTATVSSFSFSVNSGTFDSGTIYVFGA
jgi:hypothetical protein